MTTLGCVEQQGASQRLEALDGVAVTTTTEV
jgi:hypothetical protein